MVVDPQVVEHRRSDRHLGSANVDHRWPVLVPVSDDPEHEEPRAVLVPMAVTDVGLTTFLIVVAVRTLYGFITESMTAITALKAEAGDPIGFPFGHWPKARSAAYAR